MLKRADDCHFSIFTMRSISITVIPHIRDSRGTHRAGNAFAFVALALTIRDFHVMFSGFPIIVYYTENFNFNINYL